MGNHEAGRAAVRVAEAILARRTTESALSILDEAFGPLKDYYSSGSGCDAEFDDALWPDTTLGKLLIEAFAPDEMFFDPAHEDDWDSRFYEQVIAPFRARFHLW